MLDLSDLPIIDDHAHMFSLEAKNANPVRSFTMLESPKDIEHQLIYHAAAHALAKLYGCEPDEEEIFKLRKAKAQNNFKILMSHDPSHWSHEVIGKTDIDRVPVAGKRRLFIHIVGSRRKGHPSGKHPC